MLTNKDIIEALEAVGYSDEQISKWSKIDIININKMKKNEDVGKAVETKINQFFRINMSEADIGKLGDEEFRNTHLIMTPTGFKKVDSFTNEGEKPCIKIKFENYYTNITSDSQIQLADRSWVKVSELKVGNKIRNYDGQAEITDIKDIGNVDCCSITIEGDEYYLDGVVTR